MKQYYEDNKEHLKQYKKQYRKYNNESIKQKEKHKDKHYREDNKEHINETVSRNICGCQTNRHNTARHQKTNKCKLIATKENKQI